VSGRTDPGPRCGCGEVTKRRLPEDDGQAHDKGFCIDPVERCIQSIEADPAAPSGLVRQVRRQRRAIFEVGEVVDTDQRGDRLAVLADGDGTLALPGLGDELTQMCLGRGQRIRHVSDGNTMHRPLRAAAQPAGCQVVDLLPAFQGGLGAPAGLGPAGAVRRDLLLEWA
jgi:hypothetical protein